MSNWSLWVGLIALVTLLLFATLNLALRVPSRTRMADEFRRRGLGDVLEAFAAVRPQYMMATAIVRTLSVLALVLVGLDWVGALGTATESARTLMGVGLCLVVILVFGLAIPYAWSKYGGESLIVRMLPLLAAVRWVCLPVIVVLELFDPLVRRLSGVPAPDAQSYADEMEQEILSIVREGERHGAVDEEEKEMIESVIELTDTKVEEIMTPRTEIVALPKDADLQTVLATIRSKGHSRIPIFDGTIDTVLGMLYAKDLLARDETGPFQLDRIVRRALFVPESKLVRELLREFQTQKVHIAIVLDEYGGTAGLVTIEDILEELVGDISDEYDPTAPVELKRIDDTTVEVDARMRIDDLNDQLNIELPEDGDYETIGGFVFSRLGRIPRVGEQCEHENIDIQVIAAEPQRIRRVRLNITPPGDNNHDRNAIPA